LKNKVILILTTLLILTILIGCSPQTPPPTPSPTPEGDTAYNDGTYTAKGEADDKGWTPEATIVIKDGKITEARYDEYSSESSTFKTEDEEYKESFMNANKVDIVKVYERFGNELVEKQDPNKVDATGGATSSGNKFIELANKALKQAQ